VFIKKKQTVMVNINYQQCCNLHKRQLKELQQACDSYDSKGSLCVDSHSDPQPPFVNIFPVRPVIVYQRTIKSNTRRTLKPSWPPWSQRLF